MSADTSPLDIRLMDRKLKVSCPEGEEQQLLASVAYLNKRIQEIKSTGRVVDNERVALLAALNITHEFLSDKTRKNFDISDLKRRITNMHSVIENALGKQEKLF